MEPQTCPTCGAAVIVGGAGTTHYYVPVQDADMTAVLQEILAETRNYRLEPWMRLSLIYIKAALALGIDPIDGWASEEHDAHD